MYFKCDTIRLPTPHFRGKTMFDRRAVTRTSTLHPVEGSKLKRYAIALLAMAAVLALRLLFQPILGDSVQFVNISAATVFAAWYCGAGPAAISTIVGIVAANVLFVSPYLPLGPLTEKDIVGEVLVVALCAVIIAMGESGRRAFLRLSRVHEALLRSRMQLKFRVRQKTAQLQQSNRDLRDLSVRLLRVQDDERRRIARDLHDSTGQAVTALKLELACIERELAARDAELARRLASCMEDARLISDELRTISYLLHPPLLDELGLASALRWYVDGFQKRSGINVNLNLNIAERQPPEMETMLFRVVQECLINVHRHSGSKTASIRLSQSQGQLVMEIEDQGKGLTAEELSGIAAGAMLGVGLRGIRERIKDFGGELEVLSSGQGTMVKATIPIEMRRSPAAALQPEAGILSATEIARRAGAN
jgi:signal transduction histidine kinase